MSGRLAQQLEAFFTERLLEQKRASEHTVASYRDTFRLLLQFMQQRLGKAPSTLELENLDARLVGEFLNHLEKVRGNSIATRNVRLAAIHSFFRFLALREPAHSGLIQGVLAIPTKRTDRRPIEHLSREEVEALLAAPDTKTWLGRRDRMLLHLATETGLRVSELTGLRRQDVHLGRGPHVRCLGKGRKERCTPLSRPVVQELKSWLAQIPGSDDAPLFPSVRGGPLSRDAVSYLLSKHARAACARCPSMKGKHVTPHGLRHTRAVTLLESGVDQATIALWLGHESPETTRVYLHASLALKERALERTRPTAPGGGGFRYKPDDRLLAFLEGL
jgi:site-specific recombinase XerD